ncbi:Outer membrane protein assembly factor BamD [Candidatus Providencia siddallii]|uniref:Outer membrane protein assembly factor BamD n=1 Tax=Candidatus Providencia siddallii TaxID=1715285 RepID=A0A0M6W724_9GAMM|nr:Outer membrane protein assembly factor BamD [Candidatus Providencia siddallii]
MINIKYILIIFLLNIITAGCSNNHESNSDDSIIKIYNFGQQKLHNGEFRDAIKQFEILNNDYPFSLYADQVQLNLIYAYYKSYELLSAINIIDRFISLNPVHTNLDYVIYMRGLIAMDLDDDFLHSFFGLKNYNRNTQYVSTAFKYFRQLVFYYPNSLYVADAGKRLIYLKNRLANFDFSVIKYYNEIEAYVAIINRVNQMLQDHPYAEATFNSLKYMRTAYEKLGLNEEANKVNNIIMFNK